MSAQGTDTVEVREFVASLQSNTFLSAGYLIHKSRSVATLTTTTQEISYSTETDKGRISLNCASTQPTIKVNHGQKQQISMLFYYVFHQFQRFTFGLICTIVTEYTRNRTECCCYKPGNQKLSGLLKTPICSQRLETIAIDLFGPLPETNLHHRMEGSTS
ncbi:hypothetical protein CDAR_558261 [Caerostris darwini]|uniref:Uncharacterized protein n=1 Tax=Caerostris darwini TaxID=1538125 RepID=A0AAV4R979_9ARAC|nr:hypothetical protein CDAR_558261 [Caerostris darwini]